MSKYIKFIKLFYQKINFEISPIWSHAKHFHLLTHLLKWPDPQWDQWNLTFHHVCPIKKKLSGNFACFEKINPTNIENIHYKIYAKMSHSLT